MPTSDEERQRLDRRIHNQRARLRWWENLFNMHVHAHKRKIFSQLPVRGYYWYYKNKELSKEIAVLKNKLLWANRVIIAFAIFTIVMGVFTFLTYGFMGWKPW